MLPPYQREKTYDTSTLEFKDVDASLAKAGPIACRELADMLHSYGVDFRAHSENYYYLSHAWLKGEGFKYHAEGGKYPKNEARKLAGLLKRMIRRDPAKNEAPDVEEEAPALPDFAKIELDPASPFALRAKSASEIDVVGKPPEAFSWHPPSADHFGDHGKTHATSAQLRQHLSNLQPQYDGYYADLEALLQKYSFDLAKAADGVTLTLTPPRGAVSFMSDTPLSPAILEIKAGQPLQTLAKNLAVFSRSDELAEVQIACDNQTPQGQPPQSAASVNEFRVAAKRSISA